MTAAKDYYAVLGVPRNADEKTVKAAFRRLARECHPDVNPGDPTAEERFKELGEAYAVLSDPEKRAAYDRFGPDFAAWQAGGAGPAGYQGTYTTHVEYGDLGDIGDLFETLLGGGGRRASGGFGRRTARARGEVLQRDIDITFETALFGGTEVLRVELDEPCPNCDGLGTRYQPCSACGGTGRDRSRRNLLVAASCQTCAGRGEVPGDRCAECRGSGAAHRSRRVEVDIPAGVKTGSQIRVRGEGMAGTRGGERGDLMLRVRVGKHAFFDRSGDDITCEVPVTFAEAALGAEITVPTKDGRATLRVPPGTQSGQTLRLRGMGFPKLRGGGTGDQLVTVKVVVPKKLSRKARELVEELGREANDDPRAHLANVRLRK